MDSVCYSCGGPIADQSPFCPSCGAPQIRVPSRESTSDEVPEPAPPPPASAYPVAPPPMLLRVEQPERIHWKILLRIVFPFAAVVGISQALYPAVALLLLPGSVIVAIQLYRRRQPDRLRPLQGAKMGAFTGLTSFAFYALVFAIKVTGDPGGLRQDFATALARNPTPEVQQMGQALISSTGGFVLLSVLTMIVALVVLLVIGSVSGALAARLSKEKSQ